MSISLVQYGQYLQYMFASVLMLLIFGTVYLKITPVRELKLIKNGNLACALSWGAAAAVLQILVYFAATRLIPQASEELAGNNVAVGTLFGSISIAIGLLNAACLS